MLKSVNVRQRELSPSLLVWLNVVAPLGLAAAGIDRWLVSGAVQSRLPDDPNDMLWFAVIFTVPHILYSFVSFADREYLAHYSNRLLTSLQAVSYTHLTLPTICSV